ncbi:hypothetical protein BT96DRAFT_941589 [Gymnopus androsaceus JB14]|uniref:MFS general substrate transporter n=1 Tax=Gymnopus androsaceus JB14 TaxID=1447944 RepID=A0A6A4HFT7_9AGAR|nr:hypothetical protein BT96DRAFT_941589 [Gymnopus androsaceus JB14]
MAELHFESQEKQSDTISKGSDIVVNAPSRKPELPLGWRVMILALTCLASFGNHWSNGLIVALKTTIIKEVHINNSQFATLVACTNLVNTFLCISFGFCIDKWGGPLLTVIMAAFHLAGSMVMAGSATNNLNSYPLLIRREANLGSYGWALWISAVIGLFSLICAIAVYFLDKWVLANYEVTDHTDGLTMKSHHRRGVFSLKAVRNLPLTFCEAQPERVPLGSWFCFSIFENAGVQSFVSISTVPDPGAWSVYSISMDRGFRIFFAFDPLLHSSEQFILYILYAKFEGSEIVEIIRSIIGDPQWFATAFAIKKSVVQASIVIITVAAGKLQDDTPNASLDPAVTLWLVYAFISVAISGALLIIANWTTWLPAARSMMQDEEKLLENEKALKKAHPGREGMRWIFLAASAGIILIGWIMFGLGVEWGVHGSVIAGTVGE